MRSVFVDTNVLIYARGAEATPRTAEATAWVAALAERSEIVLSAQVVNEFVAVSIRRFRDVPLAEIHHRARALLPWCYAPLGPEVIDEAMDIQMRYGTSWWDALIVSSALAADCRFILSEDMQDGMTFGGLKVVHPFRNGPETVVG
jgi:predicted nucleic acid-binding protein